MKDQRMTKLRLLAPALAGLSLLLPTRSGAATITENFSANPLQNGWQVFGNTDLFQWDSTNQNLRVTWDSSQPNSYFYYPLGTILAQDDDFSMGLDLRLTDIMSGTEPGKTGPMEIAMGFLNFTEASGTNFLRGVYEAAPDIAELDYFAAGYYEGYGPVDPTVSPTITSTNGQYDFTLSFPFEFPTNVTLHIAMSYTASNQTLVATVTSNGASLGPIQDVVMPADFDFRLTAFSISSYSSAGDDYDSVLAHGTIDNLIVTVPPPPVQNLTGAFGNGAWQAQFLSRTNWLYALEATTNFQSWTDVSGPAAGDGTNLVLHDTNPPPGRAFYRVRASRP